MTDRRKHGRLFAVALCIALGAGAARAEPALWKVTGGKSDVYLFGSVHLLPEGGFEVGGELADALKRADRVCMEIDPASQDESASTAITLARAVDPDGRTSSTCSATTPTGSARPPRMRASRWRRSRCSNPGSRDSRSP